MTSTRFRFWFAHLAMLFVLGGLVACGGGGDEPGPTSTVSQTVPTEALDQALVARGETLFGQFNCALCHSVTGGTSTGPALNGIYGTERKLDTAESVVADDAYLRQSITDPNAAIVEGYPRAVMAAAMSNLQSDLSDPETLDAIVAYIQSLP